MKGPSPPSAAPRLMTAGAARGAMERGLCRTGEGLGARRPGRGYCDDRGVSAVGCSRLVTVRAHRAVCLGTDSGLVRASEAGLST